MNFNLNLSKEGWDCLFDKPYQKILIQKLLVGKAALTSREAWKHANEQLGSGESISRASVINFLEALTEEGFLTYREETGKGGHHRIYTAQPGTDKRYAKSISTTPEKLVELVFQKVVKELREVAPNANLTL